MWNAVVFFTWCWSHVRSCTFFLSWAVVSQVTGLWKDLGMWWTMPLLSSFGSWGQLWKFLKCRKGLTAGLPLRWTFWSGSLCVPSITTSIRQLFLKFRQFSSVTFCHLLLFNLREPYISDQKWRTGIEEMYLKLYKKRKGHHYPSEMLFYSHSLEENTL